MTIERLSNETVIRLPAQVDQRLIEVMVEYFRLIEVYYQTKNASAKLFLLNTLEKLYWEYLAQKAEFDPDFLDRTAEELKANWWLENKDRILKETSKDGK
jgi:hypothetical protein